MMDRRHFLLGSSALSVVLASRSALAEQRRRVLILVELKGGNDGLNTVIPYADPLYHRFRPGIGVPRDATMQLDERVGLNRNLEPLMKAWKAGDFAIVQGVGYPSPNRSHFRSIEIWDTASASDQVLSEGWVSRAFEGVQLPRGAGVDGIVADTNALPMTGPGLRTIVMQDAANFLRQAAAMKAEKDPRDDTNPALRHLLEVRHEVNAAAAGLHDKLHDGPVPAYAFAADNGFGHQLDLATRIVMAHVPVVAIKVALIGFDTHANQVPTQDRLLGFLASGLATLRENLIAAGLWNDVLVMTYSEFGRRVRQNASGGTDHGTAAAHFVMGGKVRGGLHGAYPSLADLQDGDLKYAVDFRNLYSTLAQGCWGLRRDFGQRQARPLDLIA
ncbi:DUF1501 domain-containing protein [Enhydrobacter sp.]|uniref:DUF1501 domain-containing protein n=1 Tax=Enhydrobacter sp. TaxID=1894999 RepID=UPI0026126B8C|nr:DUF1501 domain-containing protein [Enhydrobacter sp.]